MLFWLAVLALVWRGSALWMSQVSIFSAAPDGTVAAIYLQINDSTKEHIDELLNSVPLISNRSLDFEDITSLTSGEFAVFLTNDGHRSVAIRADEEGLESALFKNLGVTTQKVGRYILLSETLASVSGLDVSHTRPFFPSFSKAWLGSVWIEDYGQGDIHTSNTDISIEFKSEKQQKQYVLSETDSIVHALINTDQTKMPELFSGYFPYFNEISEVIVKTDGILLTLNEDTMDENMLIEQIQQISAANNPSTLSRAMVDGSSYTELQIEPSMVTVEEVNVSGKRVFRAGGLFGLLENNQAIISTSESLLESYLQPVDELSEYCSGASVVVSPDLITQSIKIDSYDPRLALISIIDRFSVILLEKNKYSNVITFSTKDCG